jgi:GAF domain-containing protein
MNANPPTVAGAVQRTLGAVADLACRSVPSAVAVSVTLVSDGRASTVASTSDWAVALDRAQYSAGYGPCVEASIGGEVREMIDAARETRWPAYAEAALATGALSSLSIPVPVDDDGVVAALNAFATTSHAFTAADQVTLRRLAGTAAAALTTVPIGGTRLRTRTVVDQAKGILMTTRRCTAAEALDLLGSTAGQTGASLLSVAEDLVRETTTPS